MRAEEFAPKWSLLNSSNDKSHWGENLINIVQSAYKYTDLGSFVNSLNDVQRSDWLVLDWDKDNRQDCAVFYRTNRPNETWTGYKIQGVGHDRRPDSKQHTVERVRQLLAKPGWWIESSADGNSIGKASGAAPVTDEALLQVLFPNTELTMLDNNGKYQRRIPDGKVIKEIVYGNPNVK